jgi:hypothetical protein
VIPSRRERQAHALRLDGDAALLLELHAVEELRLLLAVRDHAGDLEDAVGQRALAVVDVRDDAEITDACGVVAHGCALGWATARAVAK